MGPIQGKNNRAKGTSQENIDQRSSVNNSCHNENGEVNKKGVGNKLVNKNDDFPTHNNMNSTSLKYRKIELRSDVFRSLWETSSNQDSANDRETAVSREDEKSHKSPLNREDSGCYSSEEENDDYHSRLDLNNTSDQQSYDNDSGYENDLTVDVDNVVENAFNRDASDFDKTEKKRLVDSGIIDSGSMITAEPEFRIRPDVKASIAEHSIELLEEKISVGFRDPSFVEATPPITDANVHQSEIPSSGMDEILLVYEKTNIHKMIDLLTTKTKELHPNYKDFVNINLRQTLKSYAADDDYSQIKNLHESLQKFSVKLKKDYQLNKTKQKENKQEWSDEKYQSLIDAYQVLGDIVEDQANRCQVVECKLKLKKSFNRFQNPSEESFIKLRSQGGLNLGIASVEGGFEISSQVLGCDDTKIRVFKNTKGILQISVGNNMFKGYIEGAIGKIDGKVFNNLDEFIDFYADKILLNMHKWQPGKKIKRSTYTIIKDKKHRKCVLSEMPFLQRAVNNLNLLGTKNVRLKHDSKEKDSPLSIERFVYEGRIGGEVANVASINLSAIKWNNKFTKNIKLLQQLDNNPQWLNDYSSNYFNLSIPSDIMSECIKYLEKHYAFQTDNYVKIDSTSGGKIITLLSKRLSVLEDIALNINNRGATLNKNVVEELNLIKKMVESLIKINYEEYKEYCDAVNIVRSNHSKSKMNDKAKDFKSERKKLRGAKCSANMLGMMMVSHAKLKNMYHRSTASLEPLNDKNLHDEWQKDVEYKKEDLKEMSLDMSVPDIYVSESDREKYLTLQKKMEGSIQFESVTSKLGIGPIEGVVHVRRIRNKSEPNPDSDGKYLYITLRASLIGTASVMESTLMSALTKLMGTLPPVDGESEVVIDPMAGVDVVLQEVKRFKLELFFVEGADGKYHMQYKRYLSGEESAVSGGLKISSCGVAPINVKTALSKYQYHFEQEVFGSSTMTYLMTRYNGWKMGNKMASWDDFIADKHNKISLAKLMLNMSTVGNNANNEFEATLAGVRSYYEDRAIKIDKTQAESEKGVLNDATASNVEKQEARKVLSLYANHNNEALTEKDYIEADNLMQASSKNGRWETNFDELKKEYELLKDGPPLPSSLQSKKIIGNLNDFIDAVNEMKEQLKANSSTPLLFHRFLEKTAELIGIEKARLDVHRSTMKSSDVEAVEEKIIEMERVQSQLNKHVKIKRKHTAVGVVTKASWTGDGSTLSKKSLDSLNQFNEIFEEYKVLCPIALDGGEKGVLEHLIGTEKFKEALFSLNQLFEANHEVYLEEANSRFQDINPNKPTPYEKS